mmetsp:Transcript_15259/g.40413  ORF Transcript_15259/g.40413 Transcript_15259/m.40413 type:complete len:313 (-) Transcript_15259:1120-2058(-)
MVGATTGWTKQPDRRRRRSIDVVGATAGWTEQPRRRRGRRRRGRRARGAATAADDCHCNPAPRSSFAVGHPLRVHGEPCGEHHGHHERGQVHGDVDGQHAVEVEAGHTHGWREYYHKHHHTCLCHETEVQARVQCSLGEHVQALGGGGEGERRERPLQRAAQVSSAEHTLVDRGAFQGRRENAGLLSEMKCQCVRVGPHEHHKYWKRHQRERCGRRLPTEPPECSDVSRAQDHGAGELEDIRHAGRISGCKTWHGSLHGADLVHLSCPHEARDVDAGCDAELAAEVDQHALEPLFQKYPLGARRVVVLAGGQ